MIAIYNKIENKILATATLRLSFSIAHSLRIEN